MNSVQPYTLCSVHSSVYNVHCTAHLSKQNQYICESYSSVQSVHCKVSLQYDIKKTTFLKTTVTIHSLTTISSFVIVCGWLQNITVLRLLLLLFLLLLLLEMFTLHLQQQYFRLQRSLVFFIPYVPFFYRGVKNY